jgi:hypothetical protein
VGVISSTLNRPIVINDIAKNMIFTNTLNVDLTMEKGSFLTHVLGQVMIDQMLYVTNSRLAHYYDLYRSN